MLAVIATVQFVISQPEAFMAYLRARYWRQQRNGNTD
jgi:hypothetical protein